jgi:ribose-phosphate pyrophosphokinase
MIKILDKYNNKLPLHVLSMPDGAPHCDLSDIINKIDSIYASITNFNDFGILLTILDVCKRYKIKYYLHLSYVPMRQDRLEMYRPLTVDMYAKILSLYTNNVTLYVPHSDIAINIFKEHIKNVYIEYTDYYKDVLYYYKHDIIVLPDAGAKRFIPQLQYYQYIQCSKKRDGKTGLLSSPTIHDPDNLIKGNNLLIIDDICDGGGTFIQLADKLKEKGAANISLCVFHGIFSKGYKELNKRFDRIYTSDSYIHKPDFCLEVADHSYKVEMVKIFHW